MSHSVLYMSMSLDGFIAGPNDEPGMPVVTISCACMGGKWLRSARQEREGMGRAFQLRDHRDGGGACGSGTVEQADHWGGNHHGAPIFVPSHRPPGVVRRQNIPW